MSLLALGSGCAGSTQASGAQLEAELARLRQDKKVLERRLVEVERERDQALIQKHSSQSVPQVEPSTPRELAEATDASPERAHLEVVHLRPDADQSGALEGPPPTGFLPEAKPEPPAPDESDAIRPVLRVHGNQGAKVVHVVGAEDEGSTDDLLPGAPPPEHRARGSRKVSKSAPLPPASLDKTRAVAPAVAEYDEALALVRSGKVDEGALRLERFLEKFPAHPYSDNALYWLGECHYARGDYELAARTFREVVERFPHENKVPAALLKWGHATTRAGDETAARAIYQRLLQQYPEAPSARLIPARFAEARSRS